jgi:hypothetical protein
MLTGSGPDGSVFLIYRTKLRLCARLQRSELTGDFQMQAALDTEVTTVFGNAQPQPERATIDLADLVSLLLSSTAPDRDTDLLVDAMLGGKNPQKVIDEARVRAGFWLREQVPAYTAGNEAIATLAHRRGLRVETHFDGDVWHVETRSVSTGAKVVVKHALQGVAGIAGIASLITKENAE